MNIELSGNKSLIQPKRNTLSDVHLSSVSSPWTESGTGTVCLNEKSSERQHGTGKIQKGSKGRLKKISVVSVFVILMRTHEKKYERLQEGSLVTVQKVIDTALNAEDKDTHEDCSQNKDVISWARRVSSDGRRPDSTHLKQGGRLTVLGITTEGTERAQ